MNAERASLAERWLRSIYGADPEVIDELAADDVIISYPIFDSLFGKPVIRGRKAVKDFAAGFCSRWADARFNIHETVVEGNRVVVVWSFQGRNIGSAFKHRQATGQIHSWGGITLIRFDSAGKILEEIGEESEPGPFGRVVADSDTV